MDWIVNNKDWLFGGSLISMVLLIIGWLLARYPTTAKVEKDTLHKLMFYLADRQVFYTPPDREMDAEVLQSVLEIREALSRVLQELDQNSQATSILRIMQVACRLFLDKPTQANLQRMRSTFRIHLAMICSDYKIQLTNWWDK